MQMYLIVIALALQLVIAYAGYQYLVNREEGTCRWKRFFRFRYDMWTLCLSGTACLMSMLAFWYSSTLCDNGFMRSLMGALMLNYLAVVGYIDLREKVIPNELIVVGLIVWLVFFLLNIFAAKMPWSSTLKYSLLGGLGIGGVLFVLSLVLKSGLGMGDVKLFFVLGLMYGLADTYGILLFSVIVMAVVSLVLLAIKKVSVKTAIPMAPFVVLGFILSIIAGM